MTDRLDVLLTREYTAGNETKTAFTKVGVAFPTKNGGYTVKMEAFPAPKDGAYSFVLFPPRTDGARGGSASPTHASEDDIPFAPW